MIEKEKFEEYKETLLNIARLTKKDNSVIINFKISDDVCHNVVEFIQQDGTKDELENVEFNCDDAFYKDFLEPFLVDYYNNMVVALTDSIDMNSDGKYTYRIITEDNDILCVDGIALNYADYLTNLVKTKSKSVIENTEVITKDESGNTSLIYTILVSIGFGLLFILMFMLLK